MRRLYLPLGPTVPMALRGLALLAVGALTLVEAPVACAATTDVPITKAIQAPHYGDVVFHFFQDDDFTAITSLMASQHFHRIAPHDDEAEFLRASMLLSYGMHREAGEIFARLGDRAATPAVRDRAWFDLAKVRYQRGQFALAEDALKRVQRPLPAALEEERGLLQAQLLMARSDYRSATRVLKSMLDKTPGARFARYNLGVAQIKAGDTADGTATLDALGNESADTDEQRALRDRTNVALGFAALTAQQPAAARRYLERVPLQGTESNKALLGYGWAALDQQAPQSALVPWLALSKRDARDAAVLEAKIAVPYAYEQLRANGKALQQYNEAIQSFERERLNLDASIEFVRSGRLVDALLALNPRSELGEGWHLGELPNVPHTEHLTALLALHAFQESFKNLRDLRRLSQNLQAWRDQVDLFKDTLATRRQALADSVKRVNALASEQSIVTLSQRIETVAAEVAQGESRMDGVVFADARQREQLARAARVQAITDKPGSSTEIVQARDRARLVSGVLSWQLAQDNPARLSQAQKTLESTKEGLAQAQRRDTVIAKTMREVPKRLDGFDERIQALTAQLDVTIPNVAALGAEQQTVLQDMAVAELTRQKENLAAYLVQARFAVAQLYDRASASGRAQSSATSGSADHKEAADAPKP